MPILSSKFPKATDLFEIFNLILFFDFHNVFRD